MDTDTYPRPGTNADRILAYIKSNPGTTRTAIIRGLEMNPSPTKMCLDALLKYDLIEDAPDDKGHHHYTAKVEAAA
jgi:predicted transcriptional regulator